MEDIKYSIGNDKLGDNCVVFNRPVGDTCFDTCPFLGDGCYAEATEKRFPASRELGKHNMAALQVKPWHRLRAMLIDAIRKGRDVRIHERGDFGKSVMGDKKVDVAYVNAWRKAIESVKAAGYELPKIWVYSHIYSRHIAKLADCGISVYASIHSLQDKRKAERAGFRLFALMQDEYRKKRGTKCNPDAPKAIEFDGDRFVTCPEQRRGRGVVTCTGNKGSIACNLCTAGRANVLFLIH